MSRVVISLCDLTGIFIQPWLNAGYSAILVDPQHEVDDLEFFDNGTYLQKIPKTIIEALPTLSKIIRRGGVSFVSGFPPCTDVAVSGAAHFDKKFEADKFFQTKASLVAEQCRMVGELSGAPWFFENPVSVFSSIFGKPNHSFHPYEYSGYLADDDTHPEYPEYIAPRDIYPKKTCLWSGGGFKMPDKKS